MLRLSLALVAALGVVLASCAGPAATSNPSASTDGAARRVDVTMTDALRFEPAELTARVGETVEFVVHNDGLIVHEFYVGDEEAQGEHAQVMAAGGMQHDEPTGVSLEPGETKTLVYTFAEAGELLIGCHEDGHYEAGMVATMSVTP